MRRRSVAAPDPDLRMLESEKLAIAAHLHVLFRRKLGRVIDVEWLVCNREYATEIIRIARRETFADVHEWAAKLEVALKPSIVPRAVLSTPATVPPPLSTPLSAPLSRHAELSQRYVGRLR